MRTDGKFCRNSISCVSEHIPLIQTAAPFLRHTDKKKTSYRFLPTDHLSHDEDDGDEGESDKEEERVGALHQDEALVVAHRLHHSHSAEGYTRPVQRTHAERPGNNLEEKRTVQNWRCCHFRRTDIQLPAGYSRMAGASKVTNRYMYIQGFRERHGQRYLRVAAGPYRPHWPNHAT